MLRAYKYRIYPSKEQETLLIKHFGCARWVWNWALAKKIERYQKSGHFYTRYELCAELPILKLNEETKWLKEVNAQSLQQVLVNLDMAYTAFFRNNAGFPRFKTKHSRQSTRFPQHCTVDFARGIIGAPKLGKLKTVVDRKFDGEIKSVTISRDPSGKFYASVLVETGKPLKHPESYNAESVIGLDLGLNHFATLSSGEKINNPRFLKASLRKLAREQRRLDRKQKGSNNRNKQRVKVALVNERVRFQRQDFLHKLSTRLIRENQAVALESLNIAGLLQNRKVARSIRDAGWGIFVSMLEYKASWHGKTILKIGRFEPSSRLCTCGVVNRDLKLSHRDWTCSTCKVTHDRDVLAANNIKRFSIGQGMPKSTPVETVRTKAGRRSRKSATLDNTICLWSKQISGMVR